MIRGVVFDLDGTLLDSMTAAPSAYAETVRCLGGPEFSLEEIVATWHIGTTPVVLAHFLGRKVSSQAITCFYSHFEAAISTVQPFPGVVEMIDTLLRRGYRLGIYTTATRGAAMKALVRTELSGRFATLVGGDEASGQPAQTTPARPAARLPTPWRERCRGYIYRRRRGRSSMCTGSGLARHLRRRE